MEGMCIGEAGREHEGAGAKTFGAAIGGNPVKG